ncbi:MAG: type II secretion system minor pseudopilin GspK [Gammaproteobacteria bacterium]
MHSTTPGACHERGVALITALLVVALATVAAVAMATRLHVDLRRAGNLLHGEQAYAYALAAESWAQVILKRDADDNQVDSMQDDWATSIPPIAVEGGMVSGQVSDLQGRFNVNNLVTDTGKVDQPSLDYFRLLLERLGLEQTLATALLDWIDSDINATFPGGVEDEDYLLADPPYRAANRRLVDISELRLVQGYTADIIAVLAPHVTAIPEATQININTATLEVLLALNKDLEASAVDDLVEAREQEVYESVDDFLAEDALAGLVLAVPVSVQSEWFMVLTDVVVGGGRARLQSIVQREGQATRVIMRTRGQHYLMPAQG